MTNRWRVLAAVLLTLILNSVAAAEVRYSVTDLGVPPDCPTCRDCVARGINNDGQAIANCGGFIKKAFLWENGVRTSLTGLTGGAATEARGINENGDVVGYSYSYDESHCVMWSGGVITRLTASSGPYACMSYVDDLNDAGQAVGSVTASGLTYAALWDNFTITRLVQLDSSAMAVNNAGAVVGHMLVPGGYYGDEYHAFLVEDNDLTDLGLLAYYQSGANDINEAGIVVGQSYTSSSSDRLAALWNGNTFRSLGSLGGTRSQAQAINCHEQVVGFSWTEGNLARHAFVWENDVMTDLNDLIAPASGWELDTAFDINDMGWIVGYGYLNGEQCAFLLTPVPEPGTMTLLVAGAAGLFGALRRRSRR